MSDRIELVRDRLPEALDPEELVEEKEKFRV